MNEYFIGFFIALLVFNFPKILGYVIQSSGLKEIKFVFAESEEKNKMSFLTTKNNSNGSLQSNSKLRKKKLEN